MLTHQLNEKLKNWKVEERKSYHLVLRNKEINFLTLVVYEL